MTDAIELLEALSDEEWVELEVLATERPALWQVACAETRSEVTDTKRGFNLILRLMGMQDDKVKVAVLDSITALASYGLDIGDNAAPLRSAIAKARPNAGAAVSRMLDVLEEKLPPS